MLIKLTNNRKIFNTLNQLHETAFKGVTDSPDCLYFNTCWDPVTNEILDLIHRAMLNTEFYID